MKPRRFLDVSRLRVLDGGLASELERTGCDISGPLWSGHVLREHPDKIEALHLAYLEAGADCISTASYQISREAFRAAGLPEDAANDDLRLAVEVAERACTRFHQKHRRPVWLAASLGPYGAALHNGAEYTGVYDIGHGALIGFHQRRIKALASTHADFLLFETIPSLDEARAIVSALEGVPDIAAAISFTCRNERQTAHGEPIVACAEMLESARQVIAVGVNCLAPSLVTPLIRTLRHATSKKIMAYPNSGELWDAAGRSWRSGEAEAGTPDTWRNWTQQWRAAGADWIGGCCRTGPAHVRASRDAASMVGV